MPRPAGAHRDRTTLDDLSAIRRRFDRWRARRRRGARIPQELWDLAVAAAGRHGVSQASQVLRLDYYTLKARLEATAAAPTAAAPTEAERAFVEVALSPLPSAECVVSLEDQQGASLRVELRTTDVASLVTVIEGLWRARR